MERNSPEEAPTPPATLQTRPAMHQMFGRLPRPALAAAVLALAACAAPDQITSPSLRGPAADVVYTDDAFGTPGTVKVCGWFEANSYTLSATGGGTLLGTTMTLQAEGANQCAVVWESNGSATPGVVTVTA